MDETSTTATEQPAVGKKSMRTYWIDILEAHPSWLAERSNDRLFKQYLKDHPDETEVPKTAKQSLSTVKSQLRAGYKKRKRGRKPGTTVAVAENGNTATPVVVVKPRTRSVQVLEQLEARIDEVLDLAKGLEIDGLDRVVYNLKSARNTVIVLLHQG